MASNGVEFESISATSDGSNTVITGRTGEKIVVLAYAVNLNAAGTCTINAADGNIVFEFVDGGGASFGGHPEAPAFEIASGTNLTITNSAGVDTTGHITFTRKKARG